ncbi:FtsQ-type POTRA domain-containing protein [candidate division KSB1 bacterium]|nr:FtsQ-type POTRA domain-containing protein [candidate division KSB1 bacterium]
MRILRLTLQVFVIGAIGFFVLRGYKHWISDSGLFQIRKIEIRGNEFISDQEICEMVGMTSEANVWQVDLVAAEKNIRRNRLVEEVFIHRLLPDILEVRVQEKQAVALLKVDENLFAIDPTGFILPSKPGKMYNMPILSGKFTGPVQIGSDIHSTPVVEGLHFLNEVLQDRSKMYNEISEVVVNTDQSLHVYLSREGVPVYLGNSDHLLKIRSLEALIREAGSTYSMKSLRYVDLRYKGQVILGMRT